MEYINFIKDLIKYHPDKNEKKIKIILNCILSPINAIKIDAKLDEILYKAVVICK